MMCAGTIVQFRIPRVVIGDTTNFGGNEPFLRDHGVQVDETIIPFFADILSARPLCQKKGPFAWGCSFRFPFFRPRQPVGHNRASASRPTA